MRRVARKHTTKTVPWCQCSGWKDGFSATDDATLWVHAKCGKPTRWVWEKRVAGRSA